MTSSVRKILSPGFRIRLMLVVLAGLLPLFVAVFYPALLPAHGGVPAPAVSASLVLAMAVLGIVLAGLTAGRLVLAPLRALVKQASALAPAAPAGGGDSCELAGLSEALAQAADMLAARGQELDSTEHALQLARDRLRTAQRIAGIGNWDFDMRSNQVWWSDETYDIYGIPRSAVSSPVGGYEGVSSYVLPEDRQAYDAAQQVFFSGQGRLDLEHRIVRTDGEVRWVHGLGESELDDQGHPVMLSGTVQDITERKLAAEALRAADAQTRLVTDAMPQIVCILRGDGWLTYSNQVWLSYTGLPMEDSLGQGWMQLIHPDDRPPVLRCWAEAALSGNSYAIEYRLRRHDGLYRWMLGRAHRLPDTAGHPARWLGTLTDIDDLRVATAQLEQNLFMNRIAGRMARLGNWSITLPERRLTWSDENCLIHEVAPGYVPTLEEGINYFLPEDRARVNRLIDACAQHGTAYEFVLPKMTAKGRLIWVRSMGEAVRDADGTIIGLQGAFQDITEQKLAETRTLALEARMMSTLESITDGFSLMDADWRFTFLNRQAERMLQRPDGELLGKNLWEEFPDIVGTPVETEYRAAVAEKRTTRFEAFYRPLQTWFAFHVYPTDVGTAVYFQDITARREEQAQLRLLETAVSRLNDMVIITEVHPGDLLNPTVVFVNDAFERQTGYSREDVLGKSMLLLWSKSADHAELHRVSTALEHGRPLRVELSFQTKSGTLRWLEIDIAPIAGESGKLTHWVAVDRDITERKQQQHEILKLNAGLEERVALRTSQLAEVNKELEAFAYSVSHDLRSPLNTVDGFSKLLLRNEAAGVSDTGRHYISRISAGVKQMADLIEGLLTLAHLSREEIRSEAVDLSAVVRDIAQTHREKEPQRDVVLQVQDDLHIDGDPRLLRAVLQNLLDNAFKFSARRAQTRIEVGRQPDAEGGDVFFVRDNGAGFDMAFAHKLFGTFERLHSPGDFTGNGIGLATVKRVLERHGGSVWAESRPDEGATFYFTVGRQAGPPQIAKSGQQTA